MTIKKLPPDHKLLIGLRVRAVREAAGLNGVAFAESYESSNQANWNREAGINRIAVDDAMRIQKVHGVPIEWLYMGIPARLYVSDDARPFDVLGRHVIEVTEEAMARAAKLIAIYNRLVKELDQALATQTSTPKQAKQRQSKAKQRPDTTVSAGQPRRPKVRKTMVALAGNAMAEVASAKTRNQEFKPPASARSRQRSRQEKR